MQKLLVADSSEETTHSLKSRLKSVFEVQVCNDGETALELLHSFRPDILALDLMLPFKDGLTVLQESDHQPQLILASTRYFPDYAQQQMTEMGIKYVLVMPTAETIQIRLMDLVAKMQHKEETRVGAILCSLGFRTNLTGYRQLCAGIPIFANNPEMLLSKELYPAIAAEFSLPDCRSVEHSIRQAIDKAYTQGNPIVWQKYFPGTRKAPTNKAFISSLAEAIQPKHT